MGSKLIFSMSHYLVLMDKMDFVKLFFFQLEGIIRHKFNAEVWSQVHLSSNPLSAPY